MNKPIQEDTSKQVGRRVRELRKWLRLSQQGVANFLEIPRTAITPIESGERSLSVTELDQLCALFRCDPNALLGRSPLPIVIAEDFEKINTRARQDGEALDFQDNSEIKNFRAFLKTIFDGAVEKKIDLPALEGDAPKIAARELHKKLSVSKAPVDVYDCVWRLGILLRFSALGTLSGALISDFHSKGIFGIIVNSDQPDDRIRFSTAHELGHLILKHKPNGNDSEIRSPLGRKLHSDEKDADAFAAEFLMPQPFVEKVAKEYSANISAVDAYKISDHFVVSYSAMLGRLLDLGLISNKSYSEFSKLKVGDLASQVGKENSHNLKIFAPKDTDKAVADLEKIIPKVMFETLQRTPDWIRYVQERAYYQYLIDQPVECRGSEVRQVYEDVAFWLAKKDVLNSPAGVSK